MVVEKIKTLIFGSEGMLGEDLCIVFPDAIKLKHSDLDITNREKVIETIERFRPNVVINAAGYAAVDDCEENQELAISVNGLAPGYIAGSCSKIGSKLIHYSTDYIFDGLKREYIESDIPNPINIYGKSKLTGERNIIKNTDNYYIIRTSWLFGTYGNNFVEAMLKLSRQMKTVRVVDDQFGKPTYSADLAIKTMEILTCSPGIYHITNECTCSWFEFASSIINNVVPCTSEEFIRKAKRPKYSILTNTKTTPMRHWKDALAEYLNIRRMK